MGHGVTTYRGHREAFVWLPFPLLPVDTTTCHHQNKIKLPVEEETSTDVVVDKHPASSSQEETGQQSYHSQRW